MYNADVVVVVFVAAFFSSDVDVADSVAIVVVVGSVVVVGAQ